MCSEDNETPSYPLKFSWRKEGFLISVMCSGHPSKGWPCSLWLNMHDHEGRFYRMTRKSSSLARQYKFLIYWQLQVPLLRKASSQSLRWDLSKSPAPLHPTTSTVVPGQTRPQPLCPYYGKPDGTPKSWSIYSIVSILTEPGCDHDRST